MTPFASSGDVDPYGDVVDEALLERLRRAVGGSADVDVDEHVELVARTVRHYQVPRPRTNGGWLAEDAGG